MKPYFKSLLDEAKSRYKGKLHVMGMTKCPYEMEKFTWKENQLTGPQCNFRTFVSVFWITQGSSRLESSRFINSLEAYNY